MEPIIILVSRPRHAARVPWPRLYSTLISVNLLAGTCNHSPHHPHRHRRMNHQVGVLLPMLLASSYCANLFTESCNSLIGESFAICATFMQRLRQF